MRTAVQLYTLRRLEEPLTDKLDRVADAGFDGVEFAGLDGAATDDVSDALDRTGLGVAGAHVPVEELADGPDGAPSVYRSLGADTVTVPYLDPEVFADAESVAETAERLDGLAARLGDADLRLCYHNHEFEFGDVEGRPALERLIESTSDVEFELDVGWALAGGVDPVDFLDAHADRVPLVHLKDVALDPDAGRGGRSVDLGDGDVDLDACVEAARRADAEWAVFEHDDPDDAAASLSLAGERMSDI